MLLKGDGKISTKSVLAAAQSAMQSSGSSTIVILAHDLEASNRKLDLIDVRERDSLVLSCLVLSCYVRGRTDVYV